MRGALAAAATAGIGLGLLAAPMAGQTAGADGDGTALALDGYIRTLTGIHDLGYDVPANPLTGPTDRRSGFHGQVVRLKWRLEGGSGTVARGARWRVDVHSRLQLRVSSGQAADRAVGFGVTRVPPRLVDLESVILEEPGLRAWHDVDRLSLSVYTDAADITVGRQAITWGVSGIFPVADLWARFSPFELDTEEKPGIDAVRVLTYPKPGLELDLVLADRGTAEDLSAGVRATWALAGADAWLGAGKLWRDAMAMGGVTLLLDATRLRAEAVVPWNLDRSELLDPRVTLGIDWLRGTLLLTGEYHYNGIGAGADGYLEALRDPRVARGETYYIGRHYLGGLVSWSPDRENRLTLALNALANLDDPSFALTPVARYDVGQATRFAIGGLLSVGEHPSFAPTPTFPSEFGAYGTLGYTQLSIYF